MLSGDVDVSGWRLAAGANFAYRARHVSQRPKPPARRARQTPAALATSAQLSRACATLEPVPAEGASVAVTVRTADPDGLGAVTLRYSVNAGAWESTPMNEIGGVFAASIPGQAASAIMQFYVEATQASGASASAPAAGPVSRALHKLADGLANLGTPHTCAL